MLCLIKDLIPMVINGTTVDIHYQLSLKILLNICFKHPPSRVLVQMEKSYKLLWEHLTAKVAQDSGKTLELHLLLLIDQSLGASFSRNGLEYVISVAHSFLEGLFKDEDRSTQEASLDRVVEVTRLADSVISFMQQFCLPCASDVLNPTIDSNSSKGEAPSDNQSFKYVLIDGLGKIMKLLLDSVNLFWDRFTSSGVKALTKIIQVLTPSFIHPDDLAHVNCYMVR